MPGASIIISDETSPVLARLAVAVTHPGQLTSAIAAYLLTSTQRRFEKEAGPDGVKWLPLAKRTTLKKVRGKPRGSLNMLRVSTRLYQSLTTASDDTSAEVGSNVVYAGVHQFGGEITQYARSQRATFKKVRNQYRFAKAGSKRGIERNITIGEHSVRIPARPYLGFSPADVAEIEVIGRDFLEGEVSA